MPSMTSPSPGMSSPASQDTTSPARKAEAVTSSTLPDEVSRLASASVLVLRRLSACALPRASAIPSAKFANNTVNQSQSAICTPNFRPAAPVNTSRTTNTVVSKAPTSTTNITGFFARVTGFNLTKDARTARLTISGSNKGRDRASFLGMRDEESSSGGVVGLATGGVVSVDILAPQRQYQGKQPAAM